MQLSSLSLALTRARRDLHAALQLTFLTSPTLDPRITFTRASSGTHFDSTGRLVTDGNNVARFDYDPATAAGVTGGGLVTNGAFADASAWTNLTNSTITANSLVVSGLAVGSSAARQALSVSTGKTYKITWTVASFAAGDGISVWLGGTTGNSINSAGTYTQNIVCGATNIELRVVARGAAALTATVTNISVQEVTFTPRGLLIEEQRTNLLLHSRDMTQAAWSKTDVTAARTQVGIDGVASSACLLTEGSAGNAFLSQPSGTISAASTVTFSEVFKRGNTDWIRLLITDGGAIGADAWFNLNTGALGATAARSTATGISNTITNLGGGWYRCSVTCTLTGSAATSAFGFTASAAANSSTTRVANATYIVDCAQLEVGAFATSPIVTGAATATRAADSASMTGTNFSSWFNATQGTFVVEANLLQTPSAAARYVSVSGTAVFEEIITVARLGQLKVNTTFPTAVGALVVGSTFKLAGAYDATGNSVVVNGGTTAGDASVPSGNTSMFIGSSGGSSGFANSHIRSIRYYNTRLPNSQLTALTA